MQDTGVDLLIPIPSHSVEIEAHVNPPSSQKLVVEDSKIDQQSALQTLKVIAKAYPGKLLITLSLVILENALFLIYPLFAGFAVDSIIRGDTQSALLYALAVFAFWAVGARAVRWTQGRLHASMPTSPFWS